MIMKKISQAIILLLMSASFSCVKEEISEEVRVEAIPEKISTEIPKPITSDIFPLTVSNGLLETASGQPFLIIGDSPWYLIQGPDREGAEKYLENRKQKGVNSIVLCLIASESNGSEDAYGNKPFIQPGDFTTPNPSYFSHVDFVLNMAMGKGIQVFLYPAWLGYDTGNGHPEGWYTQVTENGPAKMYQYGKYIGNRYKKYKNIIWVMGGDSPPKDALDEIREMVRGIEETAGDQIFSVQNDRFSSGITEYANEDWVDLNTTYADHLTTAQHLRADDDRDFPFYYTEGSFENSAASAIHIRSQMYLPVLMGSNGYFYGNLHLYGFKNGWDDPGIMESQGSKDLQRSAQFFLSRSWDSLIPDRDHTLLTGGNGDVNTGNYAAAALTKDGSTAIVYTPDNRKLTMNLTRISGTKTHAWWFEPSSGKYIDLKLFSDSPTQPFTPPSAGDWVLILEGAGK